MTFGSKILVAVLATGLAALAQPAWASLEDDYGIGSRATAMGGAFSALADDVSAVHYNPGALTALGQRYAECEGRVGLHVHLGLVHASPRLSVAPGRLELDGRLDHGSWERADVPNLTGFTLGGVADLERLAGLPLALGVLVYLPVEHYVFWQSPSASDVHWPMYYDRSQHLSILAAGSARLLPGLHVGAGVRVLPEARTDTVVLAEGLSDSDIRTGEDVVLGARAAPMAGLQWEALPWLRLAAVFRGAVAVRDYGQTDITGLIPSAYVHELSHYAMPRQWVGGVALQPSADGALTLEIQRMEWSRYPDAHNETRPGTVFEDTWVPRAGATWRVFGGTEVMGGYAYVPSPVRDGQEWTNFVDNDKHLLSIGSRTRFDKRFRSKRSPIHIGWHAQVHLLRERSFAKDWTRFETPEAFAANPGAPGYRSRGFAFNVGVSVTLGL